MAVRIATLAIQMAAHCHRPANTALIAAPLIFLLTSTGGSPQSKEKFMHTNRLIHEKSPYLLQHAHNPVDWYAWGQEAFDAARRENRPIFLSIGYSTCHWCHVME